MYVSILYYICISMYLFLIGLLGFIFNRSNILIILMSLELMLLAINFNLIIFSIFITDNLGQIFALYILTVAAAEISIGLAILVLYYKLNYTIYIQSVSVIKG